MICAIKKRKVWTVADQSISFILLPAKGDSIEYHNFNEIVLYMRSRFVLYADKLIFSILPRAKVKKFFIHKMCVVSVLFSFIFLCFYITGDGVEGRV